MLRRHMAVLLAGVCLGGACFSAAPAMADSEWTSTGSTAFSTSTNWTPNAVPGNADTATFGNTATQTTVDFAAGSFTSVNFLAFVPGVQGYTFNIPTGFTEFVIGNGTVFTTGTNPIFNIGAGVSQARLNFHDSSTAQSFVINNGYVVDFTNNASAQNATIDNLNVTPGVEVGTTYFFDASTAGAATITTNGGLSGVQFGINFFGAIDSADAGTSHITNVAGSVTAFNAMTSAANATIDNSGTLNFNQNATAGSATINTLSGGTTSFFDTTSGGSATFNVYSGGVLDISGLSSAGTTAGSIVDLSAGSSSSVVLGSKSLTLTGAGSIFSGVISGVGGSLIVNLSSGGLWLRGVNTYTGPTTVDNGSLQVDGSIASSSLTTINFGKSLSGIGTVGSTLIKTGATLSAGLTVQGNLTFEPASGYFLGVKPTTSGLTTVNGAATVDGLVTAVFSAGTYMARSYTILTATTINGVFSGLSALNVPVGFAASLDYSVANEVDLLLTATLGGGGTIGTGEFNRNRRNVADTLNAFFNGGGSLPPDFVTLFGLTGAALGNGLDQVTGETATGAPTAGFQSMGQFLSLTIDPFGSAPGGNATPSGNARGFAPEPELSPEAVSAYAAVMPKDKSAARAFDRRWSVWASGYGGGNDTDGNATDGSHDVNAQTYGVAAGADYRVSPDTTLGFALGGGGTHWDLSDGLGSGRSDMFQAGVYGARKFGPAYVSAALGYGWHHMTTDRTVTIAGTDNLTAGFNAYNFGGRLEAGYRLAMTAVDVTPYAAFQAQSFHTPSYGETATSGAGTFALAYDAKTTTATRTELGVRFDKTIAVTPTNPLTLRGRLAWAHDGNTDRSASAAFQSLAGTSFTVNGAAGASDVALVSAGADYRLTSNVTIGAKFEGEFSGVSRSYGGRGAIRYTW